jgi:hypothetical protein
LHLDDRRGGCGAQGHCTLMQFGSLALTDEAPIGRE